MNGQEFTETLRDAHETPLSRLGSSKWVYALTGGEMDADSVHRAAADEADAAHEAFTAWHDDESDADAAAVFEAAADRAAGHLEQVAPDGHDPSTRPMYEALTGLDGTAARAGGFLARTLVTEKTLAQMVGFFVGDADPQTATTYRGLRSDVQEERQAAVDLLDAVCDDEAQWEAARTAADAVVEAAYADYVETLESMGIKPKNVC